MLNSQQIREKTLRNILFMLFTLALLLEFHSQFRYLILISLHNELYSHILLIPLVSGFFLYREREEIFREKKYSPAVGAVILIAGVNILLTGSINREKLSQNDYLTFVISSAAVLWIGGFVLFYGTETFRRALFPLLFLFFVVPLPDFLVKNTVNLLKVASADVSSGIFELTGVPFIREGFQFHLPDISIEVAEQCSGIRSTIALFITGIIAARMFFKKWWKRLLLIMCVFPLTVFKNGLRIVTLSLLAQYYDRDILSSLLHVQGGILFFSFAVFCLVGIILLLRPEYGKRRNGHCS